MPKDKKPNPGKKTKTGPKTGPKNTKSKPGLPPFLLDANQNFAPKKKTAGPKKPTAKASKPGKTTKPIEANNVAPLEPTVEPTVQAPIETAVETPVDNELPRFADLELPETVARAVAALGFETPTPIQARAIPLLMAGHDLIGQAQTGTGKTAAFALPLVSRLDAARRETQALILAPTRELALQVADGIHDLARFTGLRVVPIYGGQPIDRQIRALQNGAHIVVGTPGRVQDHLRRGSLALDKVSYCVLDEADEMLAMGFLEEIEIILSELPTERQTAFFSATVPPRIAELMKRFLRNPQRVNIEAKQRTLETTNQAYYEVASGKKLEALGRILDMETPGPTIVFCRTRQDTQDLSEALRVRGYMAEAIHGDMTQAERERVLKRFREGQSDLLVATDVAARGLDIEHVTHVINYDLPFDVEQYIHRIGRTGRAGRSGDAITIIESRQRKQLKFIEKLIGAPIKPVRLPTAADIAARRRTVFIETVREALDAGEFENEMAVVAELCEEFEAGDIAGAALHLLWKSQHSNAAEIEEEIVADREQPEHGMARLHINMGRQDGLRPADLVGAISNQAKISGRAIGAIDILDLWSFVEVPFAKADQVMDALHRTKVRGRKVRVQMAHGDN
jgi:ATP-dependent RNA helicase DeaD